MVNRIIQKIFPFDLDYRNFIFIPLFFAFYISLKFFSPSVSILDNFTGRSISVATSEGIDIGQRVFSFYRFFILNFLFLIIFIRLTILVSRKINQQELSLLNGASLAGFCLIFFQLFGADMSNSIHFIFAVQIILFAGIISRFNHYHIAKNYQSVLIWTIVVAASVFFLLHHLFNFFHWNNILSLPKILVIAGIPIYILFSNKFEITSRTLSVSFPLMFLPLLYFISVELYFIFNQHAIFISPRKFYFFGLAIIVLFMFWRIRRKDYPIITKPVTEIIFRRFVPLLLLGIALISFYSPIVAPEIDYFEDANHILPLHQFFSFGKIPFLDSFNSHALSDYGCGLIYSMFNGADPMGEFVYRFLIPVFSILIIYFFIYKITGDGFLATWISLAYPYSDMLIPSYFNFVPLAALAYLMLYEKQSLKRYLFFFCSLIFLALWRIDLGSSVIVSGIIGLIFLAFFVPDFKIVRRDIFRGLLISFGIIIVFFLIGFIHSGTQLFVSLKDILAYTNSFQSYGVKDLSYHYNIKYFSLYFVFPISVLIIIIYSAYLIIKNESKNKTKLILLSIIFFGIFYFSNLQRGLVRHTLVEEWDSPLTSYSFFIITFFIYALLDNKNIFTRFLTYFITCTVLISNYVYSAPNLKQNNLYNLLTNRLKYPSEFPVTKDKLRRIIEDGSNKINYLLFSEWMNANFPPDNTFIDFSNTPMLYYYTNRIVPNFFDQIPHTAHNEYLQNRFLEELKNFNAPVVVFSNSVPKFWDHLDGIPNAFRHYRIADYIYKNYSPYAIIDNRCIWIKNNTIIKNNPFPFYKDTVSILPVEYSLNKIPFYWGGYDVNFNKNKIETIKKINLENKLLSTNDELKFDLGTFEKSTGNYVLVNVKSDSASTSTMKLSYGDGESQNGSFIFTLKDDSEFHDYLIRVSSQYLWNSKINSWISFTTDKNKVEISRVELLKGD